MYAREMLDGLHLVDLDQDLPGFRQFISAWILVEQCCVDDLSTDASQGDVCSSAHDGIGIKSGALNEQWDVVGVRPFDGSADSGSPDPLVGIDEEFPA